MKPYFIIVLCFFTVIDSAILYTETIAKCDGECYATIIDIDNGLPESCSTYSDHTSNACKGNTCESFMNRCNSLYTLKIATPETASIKINNIDYSKNESGVWSLGMRMYTLNTFTEQCGKDNSNYKYTCTTNTANIIIKSNSGPVKIEIESPNDYVYPSSANYITYTPILMVIAMIIAFY